ncbi:tandem-95 repeat protein [Corallococcus sp. M34]|uniref:Ig-like domain-containing protein n=1 Tax=Citreicoccus inhibens TaxID=2849499 RepID=UPI001C2165E0|nr:Ig-like domain-containing protein [Citreicoccus inhibens]MBU8897776.1 tandem-95 repeat protein [Citreicoccus inhibens]
MRSRSATQWLSRLGAMLALSLAACGMESPEEKTQPVQDGVWQEAGTTLARERPAAALAWDPYADAVAPGTTATVLNASAALGAPDGQAATMLGLLNTALVLDLGQGEEGTGDLRVYYQGLSVALVATVDFLKADGTVICSSPLHLVELGLGTHVAVVTYPANGPYRYVRLRGSVLALYLVDAVETSLRAFCGDGILGGLETCDDANQASGDGCNSICQVEPGYTCTGSPSVCDNNSAPTVGNVHATTPEDTPVNITLSASDPDGDALTFSYSTPSHGTLALSGSATSVTYTPNANFNGEDLFQVTVSDGKKQAVATVSVTVSPVNDAPVASSAAVTVNYNTSTPITLVATDVDGDALTFTATAPAHGTLSGTGAQLLYTPDADFHGPDQFTFTANDGALTSNTATVTLTVRGPPVCGDGYLDPGEVCDDGNRVAGDGCRADCQGVEVCGDGQLDSVKGEQCDDGGTVPGDGCDAMCQLDAFSNVPPTLVSGALNCTTANSNTGRKTAVDALGRFYVVMRCDGAAYVSVSVDRGHTWMGPTPLGITNTAEVAIEGGPTGTAYVAATSAGSLIFTRTVDAGASWETPRTLTTAANPNLSLDSRGDALYISVSRGSTGLRVLRNFARGANDFTVTDVTQNNAFFDVVVDKISGDVFSVSDDPTFHILRSSDQGTTFGPQSSPPGQAFYSDWTGSNGFIYVTGTFGDDNVDVIPVSAPGTSTQVTGLPTDVGPGPLRTIDADALGNGYIATQRGTGDIQLDRMLVGATLILAADARTVGPGTTPAVAALPSNGGALVAYTNGTSVYASVVVY